MANDKQESLANAKLSARKKNLQWINTRNM